MKIYRGLENLGTIKNAVATLGTFDGVHLGHIKVLEELKKIALDKGGETLVITFWPHPRQVLNGQEESLKLLNSLENKLSLLEKTGVEHLLILEFNKNLSRMNPQEFVETILVNKLKVRYFVMGYDHRFGRNRTGSFGFLNEKARSYGFELYEVPAYQMGSVSISSSKIRNALLNGDVHVANTFLGYNYFFDALVAEGMRIGRSIDFPTANLQAEYKDKLLPADGVYVVGVELEGNPFFGMLNHGNNPTFPDKGRSMEIHIFDFDQDIYGKKLRVSFLKKLREEIQFSSIKDLREQLHKDKEAALHIITKIR